MQQDVQVGEMTEIDRRIELRHAIERDCKVTTAALPAGGITGITSNVSRSGMLIRFPGFSAFKSLPGIGQAASIRLDLPPSSNHPPRTLECKASVVRVTTVQNNIPALAFEIHRMRILDRVAKKPSTAVQHQETLIQ